jgi:hypothetical protein
MNDDLGCAAFDDVAIFGQLMADIEQNRYRAKAGDHEPDDDKLNAIAYHHGDAVASFDAERL